MPRADAEPSGADDRSGREHGRAELSIRREFSAPRARIWSAWTRPDAMVRWLGPVEWPAVEVEADVRVGGEWRACLRSRDRDETLRQSGRYLVVEPPRRLVFTFMWEGTNHEDGPGVETVVTVVLDETRQGGTRLSLTQRGLVSEASAAGHTHGWTSALDRLVDNIVR